MHENKLCTMLTNAVRALGFSHINSTAQWPTVAQSAGLVSSFKS